MSLAERSAILRELGLSIPNTLADYNSLVSRLNSLIDQVGDDETHPMARHMNQIGELIEEFERQHIHELIEK
jgi:HTH-type transcriptional regulator/antitoxin HigA